MNGSRHSAGYGSKRAREDNATILAQTRKKPRHEDGSHVIRDCDASHASVQFSYEDYTVGWVCALPKELAAATAMLDHQHANLAPIPGDSNCYSFGRIGPHNVVIACLPSGDYGTTKAAVVANNMTRTFPSVAFRLMVGIGGGVPASDIRLGDVVVGHDVLQYDFGKTVQKGVFNCTSNPVKPPLMVLNALAKLRARHEYQPNQIPSILSEMLNQNQHMSTYGYPNMSQDHLFSSRYEHDEQRSNCDECDQSQIVYRPPRAANDPKVHYGTIASGNQVMKHGATRDRLAKSKNILCFEMEAAGLNHHFPCLVIRGICDYCDSHKPKDWQEYAAATAAAYAKELILILEAPVDKPLYISANHSAPSLYTSGKTNMAQNVQDSEPDILYKQREELIRSLRYDRMDERRTNIKRAHYNTCVWVLQTAAYLAWVNLEMFQKHGGFLWIKGKPGAGKSTIMKFMVEKFRKEKKNEITLDFFFNARGNVLEKSIIGLYRSMLFQLFNKIPELPSLIDSPRQSDGSLPPWTDDILKEMIEQAIEQLESSVTFFVDALDECDEDEIRDMIGFLDRLVQLAMPRGGRLYVCFSSRHYPHITLREGLGLEIVLENQEDHNADITEYINSELRIGHGKLAEGIRSELLRKASGVFMWAVLVVGILNKERDHGRMHALRRKLEEIPKDLHALFRRILSEDYELNEHLLLCFQWILFAKRPLTPVELHFAILSRIDQGDLSPGDLSEEDTRIFLVEYSKGLVEITGSTKSTVQFIHESVKDFLLGKDGIVSLWPGLRSNLKGISHLRLRDCCNNYLNFIGRPQDMGMILSNQALNNNEQLTIKEFPFLEYAVKCVLSHADSARYSGIQQQEFVSSFPLQRWIILSNVFKNPRKEYYHIGTRMLYILAMSNTPHLIEEDPSRLLCIETGPECYGCPLLAAIVYRHWEIVNVFRRTLASALPSNTLSFFQNHYLPKTNREYTLDRQFAFELSNRSILSYLAEYGDAELLFLFIHQDITKRLTADERSSEDAVMRAVEGGHDAAVKVLIEYGKGNPGFEDDSGLTPLLLASRLGYDEVVRLLLETGHARPESKDPNGRSPLSLAAALGFEKIVKLLLNISQADPNSKDNFGRTPFSLAAQFGNVEVMKLLLSTGLVDPDSKDNRGYVPLSLASCYGQLGAIEILVNLGHVDLNLKDNNGRTPFSLAARSGCEEAIKILLQTNRVELDSRDNNGRTPLALAAFYGRERVVELLLKTDQVDIGSRDNNGQTPLSLASRSGSVEVIGRFLEQGMDYLCTKDNSGFTPFQLATHYKRNQACELLLFWS